MVKKTKINQSAFVQKKETKRKASKKKNPNPSRSFGASIDHILYLQKTIGNQAVQRMIKSGTLQLKDSGMQRGDAYPREVEELAQRVLKSNFETRPHLLDIKKQPIQMVLDKKTIRRILKEKGWKYGEFKKKYKKYADLDEGETVEGVIREMDEEGLRRLIDNLERGGVISGGKMMELITTLARNPGSVESGMHPKRPARIGIDLHRPLTEDQARKQRRLRLNYIYLSLNGDSKAYMVIKARRDWIGEQKRRLEAKGAKERDYHDFYGRVVGYTSEERRIFIETLGEVANEEARIKLNIK
ncbi:MAG: hypothetical protein GTO45_36040 [Candidatus Aminicenantes bacterium]|nr:hypothetical protein [Candidatus Aminicenantes bacterium]NIM84114.1 hypothetical protein [Candidatus Aminicenantes bacterium]NIN17251.1 hypothetical protein [Candidatus Aminicenantes bacterium]NIN47269.1 hypothetical protein [Candidatus Aminicenantes bacterium]NIN90196.1 hypothetical protein [Candidatus Aminicenantes bacterium]